MPKFPTGKVDYMSGGMDEKWVDSNSPSDVLIEENRSRAET
jgi:hypothetical protein